MRTPRVAGLSLALLLGLAAPPARGDPDGVAIALRAYGEGALSDAMAAFDRALEQGGNDRAALGSIYLHLGILRAGARDPDGALRAFSALLSLDPDAAPPAGSSPLVTEPFERARARRSGQSALAAEARVSPRVPQGETLAVDVAVRGDPAALTQEARVTAGSSQSAAASGAPPYRLTLPGSATASAGALSLRVTLHDAHGSVLDETDVATQVVGGAARAPATAGHTAGAPGHTAGAPGGRAGHRDDRERSGGGSVLGSPWFWGGAALIVAGAVTATVLLTAGDDMAHFGSVEVQR